MNNCWRDARSSLRAARGRFPYFCGRSTGEHRATTNILKWRGWHTRTRDGAEAASSTASSSSTYGQAAAVSTVLSHEKDAEILEHSCPTHTRSLSSSSLQLPGLVQRRDLLMCQMQSPVLIAGP